MNARMKLYAGLAVAAAAGTALLAQRAFAGRKKDIGPVRDYSKRSGFPRPANEMRGLAAPKQPRAVPPM
jgi:hypothetical protein